MSTLEPSVFESQVPGRDGRLLDVVALHRLRVHCTIGVFPTERHRTQPLEVDLALHLDTRRAGVHGDLRATVDYGKLAGEVRFLLESAHFRLLETAAEALCHYLLAPPPAHLGRAPVEAVTLRLGKPEALGGHGLPSLQVHRRGEELRYEERPYPFGKVEVLFEDRSVGLYRLRLAPGHSTPVTVERTAHVSELVLGSGLQVQGQAVAPGTGLHWPQHLAHRYDNPQPEEQTVLRVSRPPSAWGEPVAASALEPLAGTAWYPPESPEEETAP